MMAQSPQLKLYTVVVNGIPHVVQLSAEDAELQGALPYEAKSRTPQNKSATPSNK